MWYVLFVVLMVVCLVADCLSPLENDVGEFAVLPPLVAAAAIYAGTSVFSSLFNKFTSDASQKSAEERQLENQKELMKIQQDYNKENIGLQSDKQMENWNKMFGREMSANARLMATSPSIQRSAQQSAGISPNTAFGQFSGNVASPSSNVGLPSSPSGSAPLSQMTPSSLDLSGLAQLVQNAPVAEAQADLLHQQALTEKEMRDGKVENLGYEGLKLLSEASYNNIMRDLREIDVIFAPETYNANLRNTWSDTAKKDYEALDVETQQAVKSKQIEEFMARIANIEADTSLTEDRRQLLVDQAYEARMQGLYSKKQADEYKGYIKSMIAKYDSEKSVNDAEMERIATEIMVLGKDLDWYEVNKILEIVRAGGTVAYAYNQLKHGRAAGSGRRFFKNGVRP